MKYMKQYMHRTVKSEDPIIFDQMINSVLLKAAEGGKEPTVHYFDGMGLCASITYFVNESLPEDTQDIYELRGEFHYCQECPYFHMPEDRRRRNFRCDKGHPIGVDSKACNEFYVMLDEGRLEQNEIRTLKE